MYVYELRESNHRSFEIKILQHWLHCTQSLTITVKVKNTSTATASSTGKEMKNEEKDSTSPMWRMLETGSTDVESKDLGDTLHFFSVLKSCVPYLYWSFF